MKAIKNREPSAVKPSDLPLDMYLSPMDEVIEVGKLGASSIIETRKPLGRFWFQNDTKYIGIDNHKGDAWTEEFNDQQSMMDWLNGKYEMGDRL